MLTAMLLNAAETVTDFDEVDNAEDEGVKTVQNFQQQQSPADAKVSTHATAVRVWRPLAKKSTVNQRYVISWLIVTVAVLHSAWKIDIIHV